MPATPVSSLVFAAFNVTPNVSSPPTAHMLALLRAWDMAAENVQVDGGGLASRYPVNINVKQAQIMGFTVLTAPPSGGSQPVATSLDITLWDIPTGTHQLGIVRSGSIDVTTLSKERSGIADAYKYPNGNRTDFRVTTDMLVLSTGAQFLPTLITGGTAAFDVQASITFAGESFAAPMTIKSSKVTSSVGEMQMENVVLTPKGAPTGPADNSLLGNMLLGTAQVALAADTGAGEYSTGSGLFALITKLAVVFGDASAIEQTGAFEFQGGAVYTAP